MGGQYLFIYFFANDSLNIYPAEIVSGLLQSLRSALLASLCCQRLPSKRRTVHAMLSAAVGLEQALGHSRNTSHIGLKASHRMEAKECRREMRAHTKPHR